MLISGTFIAAIILIGVGAVGFCIATWAPPFLSLLVYKISPKKSSGNLLSGLPKAPKSLEILITAHNEEKVILQTLKSVVQSLDQMSAKQKSETQLGICVGLDHCTDATETLVKDFAEKNTQYSIRSVKNPGSASKWQNLNVLLKSNSTEWIAYVDSGSIWDSQLIPTVLEKMKEEKIMGIAPSYSPDKSGFAEKLNWKLEQFLKKIENKSGGPISIHGATIFYKRSYLELAFNALSQGPDWLCDDVVTPLWLRMHNPEHKIFYLCRKNSAWVSDVGVKSELQLEYRRRRRMIYGNFQWIIQVLSTNLFTNLSVSCLALRRIFRLVWAYWILFIGAGMALVFLNFFNTKQILYASIFSCLIIFLLLSLSDWSKRLSVAFIAGLKVPFYGKKVFKKGQVSWI